MENIATISFYRFKTARNRYWATKMMQLARSDLNKTPGLQWHRLLGTGSGNGFWFFPELKIFALLGVWQQESDADNFFSSADLAKQYNERATESWTVFLKPLHSKGAWGGEDPFQVSGKGATGPVAVITRATIRFPALFSFWRQVPAASNRVVESSGLIFSAGIGEWPLVQMATFSIWENTADMENYAYHTSEHLTAIRRARKEKWFKEEMFARFEPYRTLGEWQGIRDFRPVG